MRNAAQGCAAFLSCPMHRTCYAIGGGVFLKKNEMMNRTKNTKKIIFAISIDVPARFVKPKSAATSAMTRNVSPQLSMLM